MYYSATRNIDCVLFIGVHKTGALIQLFNAVIMEIIESRSIAVIIYSVWLLVGSLKLVATNSCMKQWDAFRLPA